MLPLISRPQTLLKLMDGMPEVADIEFEPPRAEIDLKIPTFD